MASSTVSQADVNSLNKIVYSTLIVRQLQAVLKAEGQPISGLKAHLQRRLQTYIDDLHARGDAAGFNRVKNLVYRPDGPSPPSMAAAASRPAIPPAAGGGAIVRQPNPVFSGYESSGSSSEKSEGSEGGKMKMEGISEADVGPAAATRQLHFKQSPFYEILTPLSDMAKCPAMNSNRHTIKAVVTLSANQVDQLTSNKSYRCMVYCAVLEPLSSYTKADIAFPYQVELRVNDTLLTGVNLRGLKNKPGSTRPCDITDQLIKTVGYRNEVGLTYALTQKEFGFIVNFVKTESVENLVSKLQNGKNYISKETVITDMVRKNEDSDLVATSTIMSLKCPLSTLRISVPVRTMYCSHVQCFDASSFLQLQQQQAPTWTCPTCNKAILYQQLVVDKYFEDILRATPKTVESVTIDPNGKWSIAAEASNSPVPDDSEDEHDIVEIREPRDRRSVNGAFSTPQATANGRDASYSSVRPASHKRPVSEVIDLTLSDDEDEPPRRTKRMAFAMPTPTSLSSEVRTNGLYPSTSDRSTPNGYSPVWTTTPDPPFPSSWGGSNRYQ